MEERLAAARASEGEWRQRAERAEAELAGVAAELSGHRELQRRYKAVLEENKALYNTVQDLRGNIRVYCRVRPPGVTGDDTQSAVEVSEAGKSRGGV